ncbi:MAG TPA: threonine/serine exporter family protein [Bacillales bacterium]|nr:threonine/serine exporter family protein [Bacillales bacterium]
MDTRTHEMMKVCLLAGKIMLKSGAETYRVEDTMIRIAEAYRFDKVHAFVTPTAIILSIEGSHSQIEETKFIRITKRSIDLHKVSLVNEVSRKVSESVLTLEEAGQELREVEKADFNFPIGWQIVAAAFVSGCFLIMFQGMWRDFIPAFITGGIGYFIFIYFHRFVQVKFFSEVFASFIIGLIAVVMVRLGVGEEVDKIIIGAVMPLVPGVLITNAVRDLMAGHLISGLSRGAEAFLTATAIGTGIAVVITIF